MRGHIVTAALVVGGLAAAGGRADAQYRYGTPSGHARGYYAPAAYPAAGAGWQGYATPGGQMYQPAYGYGTQYAPGPSYGGYPAYGGYPSAGYAPPADPSASAVRSMYQQYLGREPDPQGFQYWSGRLAGAGGDVAQVNRNFAAAARGEAAGYNPGYTPAYAPRYSPGYAPTYNPSYRSYRRFR